MGSLLMKPVADWTASAATAAPCPKSGYSVIVRSAGVRPAELRSACSITQDEPYLPGMPRVLPLRSAAVAIPVDVFENTMEGNLP